MEENQNTQLEEHHNLNAVTSIEIEERKFNLLQRQAQAFSKCEFVPKDFRENVPNCIIAINMAKQLKADVVSIMQNMYVVNSNPSWSSTFLIASVNKSGKFTTLKFKIEGEGDEKSCIAYANELRTGKLVESPAVTIKMAKAEGWFNKKGSKWQTMPDLMLRYRAATFFARLYAPELTMGFQTTDEAEDIRQLKSAEKVDEKSLEALTSED